MGYINFSMPREIVVKFKESGKIKNFIETGTFKGCTCFWAAEHFDNVYTIEIDPEISRATSSQPNCPKNIKFYIGDSQNVLPELVNDLSGRSIFWLDGHWCNISEFGRDEECPLLHELKAIQHLHDAVILIDDARAFLGPLPPPHNNSHWPRIDEIFILLKSLFPEHFVTIADDVIYAIPKDLINVFSDDWILNFNKRFGQPQTFFNKIISKFKK